MIAYIRALLYINKVQQSESKTPAVKEKHFVPAASWKQKRARAAQLWPSTVSLTFVKQTGSEG